MPRTKEHKQRSRERILDSAFKAFAKQGYQNVSIEDVMSDAGLTRGAFYSHFKNKAELFEQAFSHGARTHPVSRARSPDITPEEWLAHLADNYLSVGHLTLESPGCPLAQLGSDTATQDISVRKIYSQSFQTMCEWLENHMDDNHSLDKKMRSQALMAMMIGAVNVGKAIPDQEQKKQLMDYCRAMTDFFIFGKTDTRETPNTP